MIYEIVTFICQSCIVHECRDFYSQNISYAKEMPIMHIVV